MRTMTSVEAQNSFGKLLDSAQREPVVVTRHGRAAAFIVSPRDMDELLDARQRRSRAVAAFDAWNAAAAAAALPAAAELTTEDIHRMVNEAR